jgi:polysaccharide export outer membrane protein
VYVGPQKLFYVHGQVARPRAYPVEPDLNVMRVLAISGGVSERGSANRVVLHRRNGAGELEQLDTTPDSLIQPGDVVFVKERLF